MTLNGILAVGGGAAAGAWLRWWLGAILNPVFPTLPLGTLAANLIGGYLIGIALALLAHFEALAAVRGVREAEVLARERIARLKVVPGQWDEVKVRKLIMGEV